MSFRLLSVCKFRQLKNLQKFMIFSLAFIVIAVSLAINVHSHTIASDLEQDAKNFTSGMYDAAKTAAGSAYEIVSHPVSTVENVTMAIAHPKDAFEDIKHHLVKSCANNTIDCAGYVSGNALMIVLTDGFGEAIRAVEAIGAASRAGEGVAYSVDSTHVAGIANEASKNATSYHHHHHNSTASNKTSNHISDIPPPNAVKKDGKPNIIVIPTALIHPNGSNVEQLVVIECDRNKMVFGAKFEDSGDKTVDLVTLTLYKANNGIPRKFCLPIGYQLMRNNPKSFTNVTPANFTIPSN